MWNSYFIGLAPSSLLAKYAQSWMSELFKNFFTNFLDKECGTGIFGGPAPSSL